MAGLVSIYVFVVFVAGGKTNQIGGSFFCGNIKVNEESDEIALVQQIIDKVPVGNIYTTFDCVVIGILKRQAKGFLYPFKDYGAIEILNFNGSEQKYSLENKLIRKVK